MMSEGHVPGTKALRQPWTDEEDLRLLALKAGRKPVAVIAKQLNRTEQSITICTA